MEHNGYRIVTDEEQMYSLCDCCVRIVNECREFVLYDGHSKNGEFFHFLHDREDDLYVIIDPITFLECLVRITSKAYSHDEGWEFICNVFYKQGEFEDDECHGMNNENSNVISFKDIVDETN